MPGSYKILDPRDFADSFNERDAFALDVLVGLSDTPKALPAKYLYDDIGSRLFTEITGLPEYYPTNCEKEILNRHSEEISTLLSAGPFNLVELGAGIGEKTKILLDRFESDNLEYRFVPIDISEGAMKDLIDDLGSEFPKVEIGGLVSDYFNGLKWLNNRSQRRNVVLFLGSSIGNFTRSDSRVFLRNVWSCLKHGDLLLTGFDLKKDIEMLLWAYNDRQGVTAKFNLNLLERINRELGGQFDVSKFRHYGTYNVFTGSMESYLVSLERQQVFIGMIGRAFEFNEWEPIHTEFSHKFLPESIMRLAEETGFTVERMLYDSEKYFTDAIWRVVKPGAE